MRALLALLPLAAPLLAACTPTPQPGLMIAPGLGLPAQLPTVTDVAATPLGGTVIYDRLIPFTVGAYDPVTQTGDEISGFVQSRVVKTDATGALAFSIRLRDLIFRPPTRANFVELVS